MAGLAGSSGLTGIGSTRTRYSPNTGSASNTSTTETDLLSIAMAAGDLRNAGDGYRIVAFGTFAATGNVKQVRLYFGATNLLANFSASSNDLSWRAEALVFRTGATTQKAIGCFSEQNVSNSRIAFYTTPGETLANAITVKVTGQSATASNDITAQGLFVEPL